MADQHGGYRQPANPAPASGPGALSQRTDGGAGSQTQPLRAPSGLPYGQRQELLASQKIAPLPAQPDVPAAEQAPPTITGLRAPTLNPNEPVTAGADAGEGPGSSVLSFNQVDPRSTYGSLADTLANMAPADRTGAIAALLAKAQQLGL